VVCAGQVPGHRQKIMPRLDYFNLAVSWEQRRRKPETVMSSARSPRPVTVGGSASASATASVGQGGRTKVGAECQQAAGLSPSRSGSWKRMDGRAPKNL
jgi:hypothetical protein